MKETKIEKGIPIPPAKGGRGHVSVFQKMEVGDSVWVQTKGFGPGGLYHSISKRTGRKFSSRKETQNGIEGSRIWRIQ